MKVRAFLALSLLCLGWLPPAQARTQDGELTLDAPAGTDLPFRFRTADAPFGPTAGPVPSRQGLESLRISGSSQFSPGELTALLAKLPGRVTLVDLRRESHGFYGDAAVSWHGTPERGRTGRGTRERDSWRPGTLCFRYGSFPTCSITTIRPLGAR